MGFVLFFFPLDYGYMLLWPTIGNSFAFLIKTHFHVCCVLVGGGMGMMAVAMMNCDTFMVVCSIDLKLEML